ncbi:MAG: hypothetical protein COB08_016545 [Rhodobacteraceae bacterium]|nr:hypothetical protein [Paracoccaceae bacterium]
MLNTFGPDKTIWGSEWPVVNLAADYKTWCAATHALTGTLSKEAQLL